jgi:hypothetical protein
VDVDRPPLGHERRHVGRGEPLLRHRARA